MIIPGGLMHLLGWYNKLNYLPYQYAMHRRSELDEYFVLPGRQTNHHDGIIIAGIRPSPWQAIYTDVKVTGAR